MTKALFTSLVIQRLQPRASPSARAARRAWTSQGLARSAWSSRSNRRKSRVTVNSVSCVDVVITRCGSGTGGGFSTRRPALPTRGPPFLGRWRFAKNSCWQVTRRRYGSITEALPLALIAQVA